MCNVYIEALTKVLSDDYRILGMRNTVESGIELVPGLAKGSKEGRLAALERYEGR